MIYQQSRQCGVLVINTVLWLCNSWSWSFLSLCCAQTNPHASTVAIHNHSSLLINWAICVCLHSFPFHSIFVVIICAAVNKISVMLALSVVLCSVSSIMLRTLSLQRCKLQSNWIDYECRKFHQTYRVDKQGWAWVSKENKKLIAPMLWSGLCVWEQGRQFVRKLCVWTTLANQWEGICETSKKCLGDINPMH